MALLSNAELWNSLRKSFPNFEQHTAEVTKEFFTEQGFEQLRNWNPVALNEFYALSMRVYLDDVNISQAKDPLAGFGEQRSRSHGYYIQRLAIDSVKPVNPVYKNLQNGDSVDPFIVRKPKVHERFWQTNFDYHSFITIQDDFQLKTIFISEFGMSEFMAGVMKGLENGWITQRYVNKLEAIHAGINSIDFPLKDSQKVTISLSSVPTADELRNFVVAVNDIITAMGVSSQTNAFNAISYSSVQDTSRLKLLVRAGYKNVINATLLSSAFNPDKLGLNLGADAVIEVANFGGLKPFADADCQTPLYPVVNKFGEEIGWATSQGAEEPEVLDDSVYWKDPNENVLAILADKGWMFESTANGYIVEPQRNARGLYTNYFASAPNNIVGIDQLYNAVVFRRGE